MKKVVGLFVCILMITSVTLPVTADVLFEEDKNTNEILGFEVWFFHARIDNLTEEIINNKTYYTFHAEHFRAFVIAFLLPIYFHFQRINEKDINTGFLKRNFIGFAGENSIFGIVGGIIKD